MLPTPVCLINSNTRRISNLLKLLWFLFLLPLQRQWIYVPVILGHLKDFMLYHYSNVRMRFSLWPWLHFGVLHLHSSVVVKDPTSTLSLEHLCNTFTTRSTILYIVCTQFGPLLLLLVSYHCYEKPLLVVLLYLHIEYFFESLTMPNIFFTLSLLRSSQFFIFSGMWLSSRINFCCSVNFHQFMSLT